MSRKQNAIVQEYGDFQTPDQLAVQALEFLRARLPSFSPRTIIEPTCGVGNFLFAAAHAFPHAEEIIGVEINSTWLHQSEARAKMRPDYHRFTLVQGDFFQIEWQNFLQRISDPILIIGNPPWVTNAGIGRMHGTNLPRKTNSGKFDGLDAVTGKSNFDISEWMLTQHVQWLQNRSGCIAMLCKQAVARKILLHTWQNGAIEVDGCMVQIDAMRHFGAAVDACLLTLGVNRGKMSTTCDFFGKLQDSEPVQTFGCHDNLFLSDVSTFHEYRDIYGSDPNYTWRSGVKHDCSKVMELRKSTDGLTNGLMEIVDIEDRYVFPLMKSSDFSGTRSDEIQRKVIVTQMKVGEPTQHIRATAPKTWDYLERHASHLEQRRSRIYRDKPRFSIFGIGPYAFTEWKVAISGFYKNLQFQTIGPVEQKPVIFDDTIYFLSANSKEEATFLAEILNSEPAQSLLGSMVFWSDKRPITADVLKRLHLGRLSQRLGLEEKYQHFVAKRNNLPLFSQEEADVLSTTFNTPEQRGQGKPGATRTSSLSDVSERPTSLPLPF